MARKRKKQQSIEKLKVKEKKARVNQTKVQMELSDLLPVP